MPTYEYECSKCGQTFEQVQSMKDEPLKNCVLCGAKNSVTRLIGAGAGVIFKGSGFYATDYRAKGGNGKAAEPKKSEGGGCCGGGSCGCH